MRNKIARHNPTIQVSHSISQIRILCLYPYAVSASATQKKVETLELKMINLFIYLFNNDHSRTQRRFGNFTTCRPLTGSNLKRFWRPVTCTYIQSNFCIVSRLTTVCTTFPFLKPPFRPFLGLCKIFKKYRKSRQFFFFYKVNINKDFIYIDLRPYAVPFPLLFSSSSSFFLFNPHYYRGMGCLSTFKLEHKF